MSKVSFEDTPSSDGVAERVMLDDLEKVERRVVQLEANINLFIRYVDTVRFTTAERDAAPWMANWEANLLSGFLTTPIPYVEPEPEVDEISRAVEAGELGVADDDAEEFVVVAANVADEDALASDETPDQTEAPPLSPLSKA